MLCKDKEFIFKTVIPCSELNLNISLIIYALTKQKFTNFNYQIRKIMII